MRRNYITSQHEGICPPPYRAGTVSVSYMVPYDSGHPLTLMNKIISNQLTAKGDFVQMLLYLGRVFIHM